MRHHQDFSTPQPKDLGFDIRPVVPAAIILITFLLTNKTNPTINNRQKQFEKF